MENVQPITAEQQTEVRERARVLIKKAAKKLDQSIPEIRIEFDLSGQSAGVFSRRYRQQWIRFNPYLFSKYYQENLQNTVPHEIAHYLVSIIFGNKNIQPHGKEWQAMMGLLGAEPERTHGFDMTGIPVKQQRRHTYRCACNEHQLSTTRHYRLQRNPDRNYICRSCGDTLIYAGTPG